MKILKCKNGHYTLSEKCRVCGETASSPHPPKFSPEKEERWGKYRRLGKTDQETESEKSS
jgi:rRNA maturation protein Nop10